MMTQRRIKLPKEEFTTMKEPYFGMIVNTKNYLPTVQIKPGDMDMMARLSSLYGETRSLSMMSLDKDEITTYARALSNIRAQYMRKDYDSKRMYDMGYRLTPVYVGFYLFDFDKGNSEEEEFQHLEEYTTDFRCLIVDPSLGWQGQISNVPEDLKPIHHFLNEFVVIDTIHEESFTPLKSFCSSDAVTRFVSDIFFYGRECNIPGLKVINEHSFNIDGIDYDEKSIKRCKRFYEIILRIYMKNYPGAPIIFISHNGAARDWEIISSLDDETIGEGRMLYCVGF